MAYNLRSLGSPDRSISRQHERLARLQQQYESVDKRIFRVENGIEPLENLSLTALKMHRSGLREDILRLRDRLQGMRPAVNPASTGMMRAFP
ncbi:DUF465 domain-containing protein [Zestomonas carbonaria]|uniref:DUF465 domain-containing protein n=1 Tax=Zestomonas carbonaria TaxID=2762745 RepID=A0A7U7IAG8_9GAMM|nr:DUF465 domain-containing protein [Pseudomonas carbonaria]CAD5107922.1 hypothetical protein PSEWESI4_02202 [Pseudomonas carbonaria]